jgi:hypothetical protein
MNDEPLDGPRDNFAVAGDSEFAALRCSGLYEVRSEDVLFRQEGPAFYHVMRRSEWDRLQREVQKVDAEIAAQEAESDLYRGM